jgi:hypothetical protein
MFNRHAFTLIFLWKLVRVFTRNGPDIYGELEEKSYQARKSLTDILQQLCVT